MSGVNKTEELGQNWILVYLYGRARIRHRHSHSPDMSPIFRKACPNCQEQVPEHIINTAKLLLIGEAEKLEI